MRGDDNPIINNKNRHEPDPIIFPSVSWHQRNQEDQHLCCRLILKVPAGGGEGGRRKRLDKENKIQWGWGGVGGGGVKLLGE